MLFFLLFNHVVYIKCRRSLNRVCSCSSQRCPVVRGLTTEIDKEKGLRAHRRQWRRRRRRRVTGRKERKIWRRQLFCLFSLCCSGSEGGKTPKRRKGGREKQRCFFPPPPPPPLQPFSCEKITVAIGMSEESRRRHCGIGFYFLSLYSKVHQLLDKGTMSCFWYAVSISGQFNPLALW